MGTPRLGGVGKGDVKFSEMQIDILELSALGKTYDEIARELSTSHANVRYHWRKIRAKFESLGFPDAPSIQESVQIYHRLCGNGFLSELRARRVKLASGQERKYREVGSANIIKSAT